MNKFAGFGHHLWLLCGVCLLMVSCTSNETTTEQPSSEALLPNNAEPESTDGGTGAADITDEEMLEDARTDLFVELAVVESDAGSSVIEVTRGNRAEVAAGLSVVFEFAAGVSVQQPLSEACEMLGSGLSCDFTDSFVDAYDDPIKFQLPLEIANDAVDPSITANVSALGNEAGSNDWDPTDNVATISLSN